MNTTAYDYVQALKTQYIQEQALGQALYGLGSDSAIIHVSKPIQDAYTKLVKTMLTPAQFDWLEYWMYECDFGELDHEITINYQHYKINEITLYKFLEITQ